ncbi:MAG TPA: DUF3151 family protein [Candidatus Micrarchaeia archaeon]|nr:DUF3151 family protein [Candidatus Micrarchaeia archaeon]
MPDTPDARPRPPALPMAAHGHQIQAHQVVLPAEPAEARSALAAALAISAGPERRAALAAVCAAHPSCLDAWSRLAQAAYGGGDVVDAYAFARVGYHRGLDRLRRHGWGGSGQVRWAEEGNRGFLRAVHGLMGAAAAIGEMDEADRCRAFLVDLDPEDGIGAGARPALASGDRVPPADLP